MEKLEISEKRATVSKVHATKKLINIILSSSSMLAQKFFINFSFQFYPFQSRLTLKNFFPSVPDQSQLPPDMNVILP